MSEALLVAKHGYCGEVLRVDLSSRHISREPATALVDRFLGGRGLAAKLYWDEVYPETGAFDPANRLIFATGPLAGIPRLAGARWLVCGKSPTTTPEQFACANLGGHWGAELKFAGYDALVIQGSADTPVYLFIEDGHVEIRDARGLWGMTSVAVREALQANHGSGTRVMACGPAGENLVPIATLLADDDASGAAGMGAVMGSKRLKAVAVRGHSRVEAARPKALEEVTQQIHRLKRGAPMIQPLLHLLPDTKRRACWGCVRGCWRYVSTTSDGTRGKTLCASASFYQSWAFQFYGSHGEVPFLANRLCDAHGIDTMELVTMLPWLRNCHREGILSDANTGLPLSKLGSLEFIKTLVNVISRRNGFGDLLARGTNAAAASVGTEAQLQLNDYLPYDPRVYVTTGLLHATGTRSPITELHEFCRPLLGWASWHRGGFGTYVTGDVLRVAATRFWGSETAVDFTTDEGNARCAKLIQDRTYAMDTLALCGNSWPIVISEHSDDHVGDSSLESQIFAAVTGRDINEAGLSRVGESVFNLQRAVLLREGYRVPQDDALPDFCFTHPVGGVFANPEGMVPGKGEDAIYRKGAVLDREGFAGMMREYYRRRGWDETVGLPTGTGLALLGLEDVALELNTRGLLAPQPEVGKAGR